MARGLRINNENARSINIAKRQNLLNRQAYANNERSQIAMNSAVWSVNKHKNPKSANVAHQLGIYETGKRWF